MTVFPPSLAAGRLYGEADGTQLEFFIHTCDVWDAMYEDCRRARHSIEFEQYILRDDQAGNRFLRLFADKAAEGVNVRLMLDRFGSRRLISSPLIRDIRAAGGTVEFYNAVGWRNLFRPSTWFPRNHTKTMLLDDRIVYLGSACLAEHMQYWRDTQIRFTGAMVEDVRQDFAQLWDRSLQTIKRLKARSVDAGRAFRYVVAHPRFFFSPIYREMLNEINAAEREVYLVAPYFLPPRLLRRAMRRAVERGVNVKVMMGEHTDVPIADHVSRTYFEKLMGYGIRLFLYRRSVLHAKYVVVDDHWATIGSSNLDYLSLLRNREANIIIRDPDTVAELKRHFENDMLECREIRPGYFKEIPLRYRLVGYLGRSIKRIL